MLLEPQVRRPAAGNSRWGEIMHRVDGMRLSIMIIGDDRRARVEIAEVQSTAALLLDIKRVGLSTDARADCVADRSWQLDLCGYFAPLLDDLQRKIRCEA